MRLTLPTRLKQLRPERPQLAVLVSLLLVSFALTLGLAWHAWDAGRGEEALTDNVLEVTLRAAADQWWVATDVAAAGTVKTSLERVMAEFDRSPGQMSAERVDRLLVGGRPFGKDHPDSRVVYCDLTTGVEPAAAACDPSVAAWAGDLRESEVSLTRSHVGFGLDVSPHWSDRLLLYAVRFREDSTAAQIAGFWMPSAMFEDLLASLIGEINPDAIGATDGVDPRELFAFSALRADGSYLVQDTARPFRDLVYGRDAGPVVHGLTLQVGLKSAAIEHFLARPYPGSRLPIVLALLLSIAVIIGVAVVVMRREADLHAMRARFVSGVSHELRTPLAQIRMFAETLLLGRVRTEADRRRSLEIIDQEARRLSHLVENILMFSRAERGAVRISPETTRISLEVASVVRDFIALPKAAGSEVRLELQEDVVVPVDTDSLRQIVNNLLDNAVKYGPTGQRVTVGLALFGGAARMWVDDEGPGIPAMDREQVFQSFFRLRRDEESRVGGSGIGLAVVRELATLHGGEAWAEEAPGGGARLVVEFPHADLDAAAASAAAVA